MKRVVSFISVFLLTTTTGLTLPSPAFAANDKYCGYPKKGELPIVLVHGFISSEAMWGEPDDSTKLRGALRKEVDKLHIETFDYSQHSTGWVANDKIGLALARKISCLRSRAWQASENYEAEPKVLVIGHSMGGLAIRYAATLSVSEGQSTSQDLGMLITIGTPSLGSALPSILKILNPTSTVGINIGPQNLCELARLAPSARSPHTSDQQCASALDALQFGSSQIRKLDELNEAHLDDLPIFAIAGNLGLGVKSPWGVKKVGIQTDIAVDVASATRRSQEVGGLGGKYIQSCNGLIVTMSLGWPVLRPAVDSDASCWHSALPHHPEVRKRIIEQIKLYQSTRQTW